MPYFPPVYGAGALIGDVLRGSREYFSVEVEPPIGTEIQFYSTAGEFIAQLGTTYGKAPNLQVGFKVDKIGGLIDFTIETARNIDIPFSNQMEVRIHVNGNWWYSGELTYLPDQDRRDVQWSIEGRGFAAYLDDDVINEVYTTDNYPAIVADIIQNYVSVNTPIEYNPSLIVLPDVTPATLEFNKKKPSAALKKILELVNTEFNTTEYIYGVNKEKQFYFLPMETAIQAGYFEGFQFQNPEVETTDAKLTNKIDLFRAVEDSDTVEFVATVEDTESQGKYGLKYRKITIPDFFDTTTAQRIATSIIEEYKEPRTSIQLNDLEIGSEPLAFGPYLINSRPTDYSLLVSECEDLTEWDTTNISNTTVTEESSVVFTGRKAIKAVTAAGSIGEYIEFELDEEINYPLELRLYIQQNVIGGIFDIVAFDVDGNSIDGEVDALLKEDSFYLLKEDGGKILLEDANNGVYAVIAHDYIEIRIDISALANLKKVRILFITDSAYTIYFDRFDCFTNSWRQRELKLQRVQYRLSRTSFLANPVFGDDFPNLIEDLKTISKRQAGLYDIFEKETP